MKRISYFILISLSLFLSNLQAQQKLKLHQVSFSAGIFPINNETFILRINNLWPYLFVQEEFNQALPSYSLNLEFYKLERFYFGLDLGFQPDYQPTDIFDELALDLDNHMQAYFLMPRLRLQWFRSEDNFLDLYSALSLGVAFIYEAGDVNAFYPEPAGHLSLMGLSIGDKLRGFLEFGAGHKGLIIGGLSFSPDI